MRDVQCERWDAQQIHDSDMYRLLVRRNEKNSPLLSKDGILLLPMAYQFIMAKADYAQFTWAPPFVKGNPYCIALLLLPYAICTWFVAITIAINRGGDLVVTCTVAAVLLPAALFIEHESAKLLRVALL